MRVFSVFTVLFLTVLVAAVNPCPASAETPSLTYLFTTAAGDVVSLDPASVKSAGGEISLIQHFTRKEVRDNVARERWDVAFRPAERLIYIRSITYYDSANRAIRTDRAKSDWEYIYPASVTDQLLQATAAYCAAQGLPVSKTPSAYANPLFVYLARSNADDAHFFYRPSTVLANNDGYLTVQVLLVKDDASGGTTHVVDFVRLDPASRKYQLITQAVLDGQPLTGEEKWYDIPANSVFDTLLYAAVNEEAAQSAAVAQANALPAQASIKTRAMTTGG